VRNVALVLGNIGGARACQYLEKAIQHSDERVRREVIEALVRMDPQLANHTLRAALGDPNVDLRLLTLRALAQRRDEATADLAMARILDKSFLNLEPTEQKEWLSAVAKIQGERAIPTFEKIIFGFALFQSTAKLRLRGMAVTALGEAGGAAASGFLEKLSNHKNERIRDAALKALHRMHHGGKGTET
jgi:HEAT repeat protein